jgi:hypothetical protein
MEPQRRVDELKTLIVSARRLGFWNDVLHFTAELDKLEGK